MISSTGSITKAGSKVAAQVALMVVVQVLVADAQRS